MVKFSNKEMRFTEDICDRLEGLHPDDNLEAWMVGDDINAFLAINNISPALFYALLKNLDCIVSRAKFDYLRKLSRSLALEDMTIFDAVATERENPLTMAKLKAVLRCRTERLRDALRLTANSDWGTGTKVEEELMRRAYIPLKAGQSERETHLQLMETVTTNLSAQAKSFKTHYRHVPGKETEMEKARAKAVRESYALIANLSRRIGVLLD